MASNVALVTGGSGALGQHIVTRLIARGFDVAFTWRTHRRVAEAIGRTFETGPRAHPIKADLREPSSTERVIATTRQVLGEPTLLVHAAASGAPRPISETRTRDLSDALAVQCVSFLGLVRSLPRLDATLLLSSPGARIVIPSYGMVGVSKAAAEALAMYLAAERPNCRLNIIRMGPVQSKALDVFQQAQPTGLLTQAPLAPEEAASRICSVLFDESSGSGLVIEV